MYERPTVTVIGKAQDVILGIVSIGDDIDGLIFPPGLEFADDPDSVSLPRT